VEAPAKTLGRLKVARAFDLPERLRAVPGVAEVELQGPSGAPSLVRLRLEPSADPRAVQEEVQRVLGDSGLRPRLAPPRARLQPVAPPPPPSPDEEDIEEEGRPAAASLVRLSSLTLEERTDQVTVTIGGSDGSSTSRTGPATPRGLEQAIIRAVAALAVPGVEPALLSLEESEVGGCRVITAVLEGPEGRPVAGSAVVQGGRAFAVARAVWAALTMEA
jgi:hypothetical protein